MATTAVVNKADGKFIKTIQTADEKKEFEGQDVEFITKKSFQATEQYPSWEELIGKVKPAAAEGDGKAEGAKDDGKPKKVAVPLTGPYYVVKPFPATPEDHPKMPIWKAIIANDGDTCEVAKAACPAENPARKTSGKYTFNSEFRYFVNTGYVALGEKPEGYDYTAHAPAPKAKKEPKAEPAASADGDAQNTPAEGASA